MKNGTSGNYLKHEVWKQPLTLLGFVAQSASLVGPGGPRSTVEVRQLTVLPAADAKQEAHHIGLLLAPQLLHIPIRSHVD